MRLYSCRVQIVKRSWRWILALWPLAAVTPVPVQPDEAPTVCPNQNVPIGSVSDGKRRSRPPALGFRGDTTAGDTLARAMRRRFVAVMATLMALASHPAAADPPVVTDEWIMSMVHRHCAMCHSENPSHTMLLGQPPPKGVVLESIEDVRRFAPRIMEMVVRKKIMPFGNETAMTDMDRDKFRQWLTPP